MLKAKLLYLKDKQFFIDEKGVLKFFGKPFDCARDLKKEGYELLHIIDVDAQKGVNTNMDVYDKLTYNINVQVEIDYNEALIAKLLRMNTRIVLVLPPKIDLEKLGERKRLLVGKVTANYDGDISNVFDVVIENATMKAVEKFSKLGKRVIVYNKDFTKEMKKLVFAVIE
ncbi:MAG: hypothetical protein AABX38_02510 [Candidatus Micrarchaeota archaeon]